MNTKHFNDADDAIAFCNDIAKNNAVRAYQCQDGTAVVNWIPYTTYLAEDGKEHPDEVWCTANGELIPLAKVTADHARNIVRTMMRRLRESYEAQEMSQDAQSAALIAFLAKHMPEFMDDNKTPDTPQTTEFDDVAVPAGTVFN